MDSFVKRFFPEFESPGADFKFDHNSLTYTYFHGSMKLYDMQCTQNRHFYSVQPMTPMGIMDASIQGGASSLDGLTRQYLTPEGTVNLATVSETLKQSSGLQTATLSAHVSKMQRWEWADNHVTLLVNMLRYTLLKRFEKETYSLSGSFGHYDDGHMTVDMDQWWPSNYPETAKERKWPGGKAEDNYPDYLQLKESTPSIDTPVLDLRGMTEAQARFTLLMLGKWNRSSRYRLDFDTPKLAENVYYRSSVSVGSLSDWMASEGTSEAGAGAKEPEAPGYDVAWAAIKAYVSQNRIFDHFSTALYMVVSTMYQVMPVTAEATYWLSLKWKLCLPQFRSVRGRYEFLNEGEAAYVSHRALSEWGYINGKLEKINLMSLTFVQAYQTGMAIRAMRKGMESDPKDVYNSEVDFYQASNLISAAAAEALRSEVPMPGMVGVYLTVDERFDDYNEDRVVRTLATDADDLDGYDVVESDEEVMKQVKKYVIPEVTEQYPEEEVEHEKLLVKVLTAGAEAKLKVDPKFTLSADEINAIEGKVLRMTLEASGEKYYKLKVPWVPMAGVPTLIMPLNCFSYNTPFNLKGVIDDARGKLDRNGYRMKAKDCWEIANVLRLCGYDAKVKLTGDYAGPSSYFAPNDGNMVWPVLFEPDEQDNDVVITGQLMRDYHFIELPPIYNRFFKGGKLEYSVKINSRGISGTPVSDRSPVTEFGGSVSLKRDVTVTYNMNETVARLRGFISRDESGFQFAKAAQAGVIPPIAAAPAAAAAAEGTTDGGNRL